MKYVKMLSLAALSAMALMAFLGAGTASATTLEVATATQNQSVSITASLKTGTSAKLETTPGLFANTCTGSHVGGKTDKNFSTIPTGAVSELTFTGCQHTVTIHNKGQLYVEWTSGTNGLVYSENAEVTSYSTPHGTHINCKTGAGTLLGTLTGSAHGHAELHVNAVLDCGPHLASAKWTGTYTVTSPTGLGVSP